MSGVYIKGMEMPTEGQQKSFLLHFNDDGTGNIVALGYPQKPYEVVPVPPHGRLIDADALFDFILNIYKTAQGDARKAYRDVLDTIVAAGDVIPEDEQFGNSEQLDRGGGE